MIIAQRAVSSALQVKYLWSLCTLNIGDCYLNSKLRNYILSCSTHTIGGPLRKESSKEDNATSTIELHSSIPFVSRENTFVQSHLSYRNGSPTADDSNVKVVTNSYCSQNAIDYPDGQSVSFDCGSVNKFINKINSADVPSVIDAPINSYKDFISQINVAQSGNSVETLDANDYDISDEESDSEFNTDLLISTGAVGKHMFIHEHEKHVFHQEDKLLSNNKNKLDSLVSTSSEKSALLRSEAQESHLPSEVVSENLKLITYKIKSAKSVAAVLVIYEQQKQDFTLQHYDIIVRQLTKLIDKSVNVEGLQQPRMLQLCEQLCRNARRYDPGMLLTLLRFISVLHLPANSTMVLTTLQMIRHHLNTLDLKQLIFLEFVLSSFNCGTLGTTLKMAVPIVMECKHGTGPLPPGLNLYHLSKGMAICIKNGSILLAHQFMMGIYEHDEGIQGCPVSVLLPLIGGLLDLQKLWKTAPSSQFTILDGKHEDGAEEEEDEEGGGGGFEEDLKEEEAGELDENENLEGDQVSREVRVTREVLLKEALQRAAVTFAAIHSRDVERLLKRLTYAYRERDECAYSQALLRAYAARLISEDWPLRSLAGAVFWMLKMNQVDDNLLCHFLTRLEDTPSSKFCSTELFVMPVIHALAASTAGAARCRQDNYALLQLLLQHPSARKKDCNLVPMTRLGVDLACLGYFDVDTMTRIYQQGSETVGNMLERLNGTTTGWSGLSYNNRQEVRQFLQLQQALQLLGGDQISVETPPQLHSALHNMARQSAIESRQYGMTQGVLPLLQRALYQHGGERCIVAGAYTPRFIHVGHALVVQADGSLVPQPEAVASTGPVCTDQLVVPPGAKIMYIFVAGTSWLLNNDSRPRSQLRLYLRMLAAEGMTPVPLLLPTLQRLHSDDDKLQHVTLMLQHHGIFE